MKEDFEPGIKQNTHLTEKQLEALKNQNLAHNQAIENQIQQITDPTKRLN